MNKLKPGSIPKIHTQGGPMKLRENIGLFQDAARAYGVSSSEVFQAVDCFDKKNIQQVTVSIFIRFLIEFCSISPQVNPMFQKPRENGGPLFLQKVAKQYASKGFKFGQFESKNITRKTVQYRNLLLSRTSRIGF